MEPRAFVAVTCHAALSAAPRLGPIFSPIGRGLGRILAALSLPAQFQHLLVSYLPRPRPWNEGHAGLGGLGGLPVYTEGFLHCPPHPPPPATLPPPSTSFDGFFTFLSSPLFWEEVTGLGPREPALASVNHSGSRQEFFPTGHTPPSLIVHT